MRCGAYPRVTPRVRRGTGELCHLICCFEEAVVLQAFLSMLRDLFSLLTWCDESCRGLSISHPARRLRWRAAFASQQIVTLAFGAKHIPFGMLFIANDFSAPVIYIGWARPDTRGTQAPCRPGGFLVCWRDVVPQWHLPHVVRTDVGFNWAVPAAAAGLQGEAEMFFPSKLLLMPLAISIAFAIIHYRSGGLTSNRRRDYLKSSLMRRRTSVSIFSLVCFTMASIVSGSTI